MIEPLVVKKGVSVIKHLGVIFFQKKTVKSLANEYKPSVILHSHNPKTFIM